jgi:LacI family transcriptional regulator
MPITIKDVAQKANVSIATVSLVIHNNGRISKDTRKRVQKVIKNLNYQPSRSARGLATSKTGNIGFILTEDHFLKTEPFYTKVFLGAEFEARMNDFYVLLATVSSKFKEGDPLPRFVLERSTDGIIIAGKVPTSLLKELEAFNLHLVFVDYTPPFGDHPNVLSDNVRAGLIATQHLIDLGHRKIAFIGGEIFHLSIAERLQGYKLAMERANIIIDDSLIVTNEEYLSRQNGYKCAQKIFNGEARASSVFAGNDSTAIGVMQYLKDKQFKIPENISIVGCDDVEADLLLDPPLTTIKIPKIDMGSEAVQLLLSLMNGEKKYAKKIIVPVELVVRKSTKKYKVTSNT